MNTESLLRDLIKVNTTNLPGNELDIVKKILEYFPATTNYEVFDHGNNRGSLIITIDGREDEVIGFFGHIDTVPVSDIESWSYNPFEGVVVDGYMYGRGTTDMKGGVASMIQTALYFIEGKIVPNYTLKFVFTADEESGGLGVLELKDKGRLKGLKEVFICEPSDESLGIREKGALWFDIEAFGISSHASKPELGLNAIESLLDLVTKLKESINFEIEDDFLGRSTFEITTIEGGVKTNIIPEYARVTLDIRTVPGVDNKDIIDRMEDLIVEFEKGSKIRLKYYIDNNRPPLGIAREDEFIKRVAASFENNKKNVKYTGIKFYTDGSLFLPEMGLPFVITGPGFVDLCHQRDEYTKLSHIDDFTKIYIDYILNRGKN